MKRSPILASSIAAATALAIGLGAIGAATASSEEDAERSAAALNAAVSLTEAINIAETETGGRVLEIEIESEDGMTVYEVEVALADGSVGDFLIDISTGEISAAPDDDQDGDDEEEGEDND